MSSDKHRPHALIENINRRLDDTVLHSLNIDVNQIHESVGKHVHKKMGGDFLMFDLPADIIGFQWGVRRLAPIVTRVGHFRKVKRTGASSRGPVDQPDFRRLNAILSEMHGDQIEQERAGLDCHQLGLAAGALASTAPAQVQGEDAPTSAIVNESAGACSRLSIVAKYSIASARRLSSGMGMSPST